MRPDVEQVRARMPVSGRRAWLVLAAAVLVAGCLSDQAMLERRCAARPEILRGLPAADQARLRRGEVAIGDTTQMVWLAQGEPTRVLSRLTAVQTNEVWSYSFPVQSNDIVYPSTSSWRPVPLANGRVAWVESPVLMSGEVMSECEYLRVEFAAQRVVALETPRRAGTPPPRL